MALLHTILATLAGNSFTGYDLSKYFDESVSCFWKASQQQIYRELGKMEDKGFVTSEIIPQEGKPAKKVYSITDTGIKELIQWMSEASEPTAIREDLLVKVRAAYLVSTEVIIQELKRRRQIHEEQLTAYQQKQKEFFPDSEQLSLEDKCFYLTLRRGIRYESEWIEWCDEAIAVFQKNEG